MHRSVAFIESSRSDLGAGQYFSLVFLVSGASLKLEVRDFLCISFVWLTSLWKQSHTKLMQKKSCMKLCTRLHWLERLGFIFIASYWPVNFSYSDVMMQQLPNVDPCTVSESRKVYFIGSQQLYIFQFSTINCHSFFDSFWFQVTSAILIFFLDYIFEISALQAN